MAPAAAPEIFVIGGTGAQGLPIVRDLVRDGAYRVRFLTRDPNSQRAKDLVALGNVTAVQGSFDNEQDLHEGYRGCAGAFVNIDGFNVGEKGELYWGIRSYEIAIEEGVKFFVWGNLDYVAKLSGFDPAVRSGHYDGKGRVGEWILKQNAETSKMKGMKATLFTTGPYIDMAISSGTLMVPSIEDGTVTWRLPLGQGAVAHVALEDCGYYVRWLFDNQERANGTDLQVAIAHLTYDEIAEGFQKATGHPAKFINVSMDDYWNSGWMKLAKNLPAGYSVDPKDPSMMTIKDNFTGFWAVWQKSGGNNGIVRRDYELLDSIHPSRIKTAEEWFKREDQRGRELGLGSLWDRLQEGSLKPILKNTEDKRRGKL